MRYIPNKLVLKAWKSVDACCDISDGHYMENCLTHFAKENIEKFNSVQRNVDIGEEVTEFSKDTKKYNVNKLISALIDLNKICDNCKGYHSESCYLSNARKAIEILLFGKYHRFMKYPFGEYLVQKGVIEKIKAQEAYQIQKEINLSLSSIALSHEMITSEQALVIFSKQKSTSKEFDEIAVDMNFLTANQINILKTKQTSTYRKIGDMLVALGYLSMEEKEQYLKKFMVIEKKKKSEEEKKTLSKLEKALEIL